jgi:OOP family OmpA-OmpF porin
MKSSTRWTIAVAVVILIAILLWLWMRGEEPKPPVTGEVVTQAAPKPEPAPPPKPVVQEPLSASVLFDYDRSEIRPSEVTALDDLAAKLKGRSVEIEGHADRIGGDQYNLALSRRRAESVRDYLAGKGVAAEAMRVAAAGEAEPVTGDKCKGLGPANRRNKKLIECLQPNRRAELRAPG